MSVTYKIGEAAALLNLKTYVLRFWETEFPQITPLRTEKGQRIYTEEHLALLDRIRFLLHERGLTIEGTRKVLAEEATRGVRYIRAHAQDAEQQDFIEDDSSDILTAQEPAIPLDGLDTSITFPLFASSASEPRNASSSGGVLDAPPLSRAFSTSTPTEHADVDILSQAGIQTHIFVQQDFSVDSHVHPPASDGISQEICAGVEGKLLPPVRRQEGSLGSIPEKNDNTAHDNEILHDIMAELEDVAQLLAGKTTGQQQ